MEHKHSWSLEWLSGWRKGDPFCYRSTRKTGNKLPEGYVTYWKCKTCGAEIVLGIDGMFRAVAEMPIGTGGKE
jgi:hypothetical protein